MTRADDESRICFNIERPLYNEMINNWKWGTREQVLIALLKLGLQATKRYGPAIIGMIVAGEVELRPTKTAIQNLNNGGANES